MMRRRVVALGLFLLAGCDLIWLDPPPPPPPPPGPDAWRLVDAGGNFTCAIRYDDSLWCWGGGGSGQLGVNMPEDQLAPRQVEGLWTQVAAGDRHACGILTDGSLWCWGFNETGQITGTGVGLVPRMVDGPSWKMVETGNAHTCAIRGDDTLWCWGSDMFGQLGIEATSSAMNQPVQLSGFWSNIALGGIFTCGTQTDGTLWCWGYNSSGQIGQGTSTNVYNIATRVGTASDWSGIVAGESHACGLRKSAAYCWGSNVFGQLGDETLNGRGVPTPVRGGPFVALTGGALHTCGRTAEGGIACWGSNELGQLGNGEAEGLAVVEVKPVATERSWLQVSAGDRHTCAISSTNELYCAGANSRGELGDKLGGPVLTPTPIAPMGSVACGGRHACSSGGSLSCWGDADTGQIADSTLIARQEPRVVGPTMGELALGVEHTCQLVGTRIFCWGSNAYGQLARTPVTTAPSATPTEVANALGWSEISSGNFHTCGVSANNTVSCWGRNDGGQLGNGNTTNQTTPTVIGGIFLRAVAAGSEHTCALRPSDSAVMCWGRNYSGQLGIGATTPVSQPPASPAVTSPALIAKSVSAGGLHTCAISMTDELHCWGENSSGQIGNSGAADETRPVKLAQTWKAVSTGQNHTCAIHMDETLWCWGGNASGQVGDGSTVDRRVPTQISMEKWSSVDAGNAFTCGVTKNGIGFCWGSNEFGQIGNAASWTVTFVPVAPAGS